VGFDESVRLELRKLGKLGVKTTVVCPLFIDTGMFNGAKAKYPRFAPLLKPDYAAHKIVNAVLVNQEMLLMPACANLTQLLKGLLPTEIAVDLADFFGVLDTMDDFRGRAAAKAKPPEMASMQQRPRTSQGHAFPVGAGDSPMAVAGQKKTK